MVVIQAQVDSHGDEVTDLMDSRGSWYLRY